MNFAYPIIDYKTIGQNFLNIYYVNMTNTGLVNNMELFDEKCGCTINGEEYIGIYHVLIRLAQTNIHRFIYKTLNLNCQPLNNGYLLSVSGICQLVNLHNIIIGEVYYTEVFQVSSSYKITNYIATYGQ